MVNDYGVLLFNENCSDLTLIVNGVRVFAHKLVLATKSTVFMHMLGNEPERRELVLDNTDLDVVKETLRYIYTGRLDAIDLLAPDLLDMAHRFAIAELKKLCEEVLSRNISVISAFDILLLAHRNSAQHLKALTIDFIIEHIDKVIETEAYTRVSTEFTFLLHDIFVGMALKKRAQQQQAMASAAASVAQVEYNSGQYNQTYM